MATTSIVAPIDYQRFFPNLTPFNHKLTSNTTKKYNCIAWAASEQHRWWEPNQPIAAGYYWPPQAPSDFRPSSLEAAFASIGYIACGSDRLEPSSEKVALYSRDGRWTHAARQLADGRWTSKLGRGHDITHETPGCLDGKDYGTVFRFMRRKAA